MAVLGSDLLQIITTMLTTMLKGFTILDLIYSSPVRLGTKFYRNFPKKLPLPLPISQFRFILTKIVWGKNET